MSGKNQHYEEGIYETAKAEAVTRVISWQTSEEMRKRGIVCHFV